MSHAPSTSPTGDHMDLCDALDRLLHKGVVLKGEVTISVANIELVYLGFAAVLASTETMRRVTQDAQRSPALAEAPR